MTFILFYLLIGLVSYWFIAPADGIKLNGVPKLSIALAVSVWMVCWLPILLYKIGEK